MSQPGLTETELREFPVCLHERSCLVDVELSETSTTALAWTRPRVDTLTVQSCPEPIL